MIYLNRFLVFVILCFFIINIGGCASGTQQHESRLELGVSYAKQGKFAEAIDEYSQAIEIDPNNALIYANRGQALGSIGNYTSAIEDATKAIAIDNKFTPAYINRGFAYAKLGEFEKAIQDFDAAQKLESDNVAIYINRGGAYADWGKPREAIKDLDQALQFDPKNYDAILLRATIYVSIEEVDKAISDLSTAIEIKPTDPKNYILRAALYYKMLGDLEKAQIDLQQVLTFKDLDGKMKQEAETLLQEIESKNLASSSVDANKTQEELNVCQWFVKTQILRAERISGLSKFNTWYQTYDQQGFELTDKTAIEQLAEALKSHQPYQEQFIEKWQELGSHPEAAEFWSKELASTQKRIEAFSLMIKGIEEANDDSYLAGLAALAQASEIGQEAENAMILVRSNCTN